MIEETQTRPRRWGRVALGLVALTTLSAGTGWGAAHLASPANAAPDLAKVRAALSEVGRKFDGVTGEISFDQDRQRAVQPYLRMRYQNGAVVPR